MKITELKNIKGYTLVEVMVAMLITFIVMSGAYQTMTRETIDMERQEIILDMQNNARVAIDSISREIRHAGFFGCGGELAANTLNNDGSVSTLIGAKTSAVGTTSGDDDYWRGDTSIIEELKGGTDVDYLGVPLAFKGDAAATHPLYAAGTDALSLVYISGDVPLEPGHAQTILDDSTKDLQLDRAAFDEGDILLITDCKDYSIFQKTNCSDTKLVKHTTTDDCGSGSTVINNDLDLGEAYGIKEQARVYSLKIATFFLEKGTYDLCFNLNDRAIASNIEDLQFEFITDTDDDGELDDETWVSTAAVPADVRAIRVWVLARSEQIGGKLIKETFSYAGGTKGPFNDNRYRYLTSSVVYLRNAGIN